MSELIANEDLEVEFSLVAGPPDAVYGGDLPIDGIKIIGVDGIAEAPEGKKIQVTSVNSLFTPTGCAFTSATYTFVSGAGSTSATSVIKTNNLKCMRKEDSGSCAGGWTLTASPFTALPCSCTTRISNAGQSDVKGE